MRRHKNSNIMGIILLVLVLGIGYAYINTSLSINGTTDVDANTWNVYWDNVQVTSGSVTASTPTIDPNKTAVSFSAHLSKPGEFFEFTVDAKNDGSVDAMIDTIILKLNGTAISTTNPLPTHINYTVTYDDDVAIEENHMLSANSKDTYKVRVEYRTDINPSDLPENAGTISLSFGTDYVQATSTAIQRVYPNMIIKTSRLDYNRFRSNAYRGKIKIINLDDEINPPDNIIESWDIGVLNNGKVMAYITTNQDDNTMYDLYIQGDGHLYANEDSSNLFYDLTGIDQINGIDNLDTSRVKNMSGMFDGTGYNSTVFTLDLGNNFDTSNVTDMSHMFRSTGYNSTVFTLDLGNKFDTSKVTNMSFMFYDTGSNSTLFTLDLGDEFNTSKVTNMSFMFWDAGIKSPSFTLDLGDKFDTRNVTDMSDMFKYIGYGNTSFTLDLGNKFDTGNVTDMSEMFMNAGYKSTVFILDLGDKFDTSKVTDMSFMFSGTGYQSTVFTLDLGDKFDTSNVTDMSQMFDCTGYTNPSFTLDLGDKFDTSQVTNMRNMFRKTANRNNNLELDLSSFDFSHVTQYSNMFASWKASQKVYVKDASDQSWVVSHGGSSNLTTSNVLIKSN